jgi:hypothetical protein
MPPQRSRADVGCSSLSLLPGMPVSNDNAGVQMRFKLDCRAPIALKQ